MKIATFVLVCVCASSAARAESLEEQRFKANKVKELKLSIDVMNKDCGTSITGTFDWSSFKYDDFLHSMGAPSFQIAPNAVQHACRTGADAKAAVAKAIKTIVIKPGIGTETKLDLKNGELDLFMFASHMMNPDDAKAWVLKHL
jgi:hypothetical protein